MNNRDIYEVSSLRTMATRLNKLVIRHVSIPTFAEHKHMFGYVRLCLHTCPCASLLHTHTHTHSERVKKAPCFNNEAQAKRKTHGWLAGRSVWRADPHLGSDRRSF